MNRSNLSFERSLALLAHPVSLAALLLMLVNDHLLRPLWPSALTGKLSDAAWLFVTPFVLAALLSWLLPGRAQPERHAQRVFGLAFGLAGLGFVLAKTLPAANWLVGRAFTALTGAAPSLVLDPGDLLALPALAAAFWLWWARPALPVMRPARGLVALPLAAMLLLADAAAPDMGVTCLVARDGQVYAAGQYGQAYVSADGGLTWESTTPAAPLDCTQGEQDLLAEWQQAPGPDGSLYRYRPGVEIQRSADGGQTWQTGYQVPDPGEPEQLYYIKSHSGNPMFTSGPLAALADPASGNMLFAMGHQGVLVHTAQGEWRWSTGGDYQRPAQFPGADAFVVLLGGMVLMAVELGLLVYAGLALRWTLRWPRVTLLAIAALGWLVVDVLFAPALATGYTATVTLLGMIAVAVIVLPLAVEQTVRLVRRAPRAILPALGLALLAGLLYLLPYVLWMYSTLPSFSAATLFAGLLGLAVWAAGFLLLRRSIAR